MAFYNDNKELLSKLELGERGNGRIASKLILI